MYSLFSSGFLSVVPTIEWSATLIGIGLLVGLLIGYWVGTYFTMLKNPDRQNLEEDPDFYYPAPRQRKPTRGREAQ